MKPKDPLHGVTLEMILTRLAEDLGELATIEQRPQQDGRNMTMMLAPARVASDEDGAEADAAKEETRRKPQQKPAGSALPDELDPDKI